MSLWGCLKRRVEVTDQDSRWKILLKLLIGAVSDTLDLLAQNLHGCRKGVIDLKLENVWIEPLLQLIG